MILTSSKYHKIEQILGKPKLNQGRGGLFLVKYINKLEKVKYPQLQSRCNIHVYEKGILVYFSKDNKEHAMPILFNDIRKSKFQNGLELYMPRPYSIFGMLSRYGVKLSIAERFATRGERLRQPHLYFLETKDVFLEFKLNPYIGMNDKEFFKSLQVKKS